VEGILYRGEKVIGTLRRWKQCWDPSLLQHSARDPPKVRNSAGDSLLSNSGILHR
jgi:hypothetical protein